MLRNLHTLVATPQTLTYHLLLVFIVAQLWFRLIFRSDLEPWMVQFLYGALKLFAVLTLVQGVFDIESVLRFHKNKRLVESYLLNETASWYLTRRYGTRAGKMLRSRVLPLTFVLGLLLIGIGVCSMLYLYGYIYVGQY